MLSSQVWLGAGGEWRSSGKPGRLPDDGGRDRPAVACFCGQAQMEDRGMMISAGCRSLSTLKLCQLPGGERCLQSNE